MSTLKGRFKSVEISAKRSEVKLRLLDGSSENAVRISTRDPSAMLDQLLQALTAAGPF